MCAFLLLCGRSQRRVLSFEFKIKIGGIIYMNKKVENGTNLDKQIFVYSVDTGAFNHDDEHKIYEKLLMVYKIKNALKKRREKINKKKKKLDKEAAKMDEKELRKQRNLIEEQIKRNNEYKKRTIKLEKKYKEKYYEALTKNEGVHRSLREDALKDKNKIGLFESVLSRTLGIKEDELSEDIIVVTAYYYQILKEIIINGFTHPRTKEKYIFFLATAGQIRNKKCVFIREKVWEKHKDTLMCGLSIEEINRQGGMNINKFLTYLALSNSASIEWEKFDIDRCIVVDDLETTVESLVDFIDRDTYEITRKKMDIPITHTDGCGMMLPSVSKKPFMCRLPWIKGLLVPFPYDTFINEANEKAGYRKYGKVKDIYGKTWDIVEDDIQIIFTKSQFKMWKYYQLEGNKEESWNNYKTKFKENNCKAAKLNEEDDLFCDAKSTYQILQTLSDMSNSEIQAIATSTIEDIKNIGSSKEVMLRILGATETNKRKNSFQKAVFMYPELLSDKHTRKVIKDVKESMVKDAKSGKLNINGKYTYVIPDLYAFCEKLFLGIEKPKGLLNNGEVYCDLYPEGELDILRSPHLYLEHAIRKNVIDDTKKEWFKSHGVYTSVHDNISKILMFDNDGDKTIVCADKTIIEAAKRNVRKYDVVPLYYEMEKAKEEIITNEEIYKSLILAYDVNIGEVSNSITKIWNSENVDIDLIKKFCMENNFTIDFAKTLFMPTRPPEIDVLMKEYKNKKAPHFFKYAKKKEEKDVEKINESVVNRLDKIIPKTKIQFVKLAGKFDYKMLMKVKSRKIDEAIIERYKELNKNKKWTMRENKEVTSKDKLWIDKYIRDELLKINSNKQYVTDVLVKYLYAEKDSEYKTTLWGSFGDVILHNLKINLRGTIQCGDCGVRVKKTSNSMKYCPKCADKREKKRLKDRKKGA